MFRFCLSLMLLCKISYTQPLTDGMAIVTHWSQNGLFDAFSIFDTQNTLDAPLGLNWGTTFHTPADPAIHAQWKNIGDVFGIAIDNQKNVYFTATRSISSSGSAGTSAGPAGDAGVYKMNAADWSITEFITTGSGVNQMPNFGVGLGNICYDEWNDQLFITNFEDGKIYRYNMSGDLLSSFDPFTADDGSNGFVGHGEAIWGINVFGNNQANLKVYFSQWTEDNSLSDASGVNNSVWSVELNATGDFMSGTETLCFSLPNIEYVWETIEGGSYPISDITFDSQGNMFLCEKTQGGWGAFGGWNDCFTPGAHSSRLFQYSQNSGSWTLAEHYAVGNYQTPDAGNNTTGGVAIGNKETENGIDCEKLIWCTGDALRFSGYNPPDGGQTYIYGAAAIPVEGNSLDVGAADYGPTSSIYVDVDYTGMGTSGAIKMAYGDIEIWSDAVAEASFTISPDETICEGGSTILSVTGGTNYSWSPSTGLDDINSANPTANPITQTTYTVTGEGACGGTAEASITISIDNFNIELGPDQAICEGTESPVLLDAGIANSYLWNTNETTQIISVNTPGEYSVEVTSPNNCSYFDTLTITESTPPSVDFFASDTDECIPARFQLTNLSTSAEGDPIQNWEWSCNNETSNYIDPVFHIDNPGTYDVSLTTTSEEGCESTFIITDYLTVHPNPVADFSFYPELISHCEKTVEFFNNSTGYESLTWTLGDETAISEDTLSLYTFPTMGWYFIQLNLVSEYGCEEVTNRWIKPADDEPFYAPNAFTPNNDGNNDIFKPIIECAPNFEFWVFNRWGAEIFYTTDINEGWNGYFQDKLCQIGKYSWKVKYDNTKPNQIETGEVHLMH